MRNLKTTPIKEMTPDEIFALADCLDADIHREKTGLRMVDRRDHTNELFGTKIIPLIEGFIERYRPDWSKPKPMSAEEAQEYMKAHNIHCAFSECKWCAWDEARPGHTVQGYGSWIEAIAAWREEYDPEFQRPPDNIPTPEEFGRVYLTNYCGKTLKPLSATMSHFGWKGAWDPFIRAIACKAGFEVEK